VNKDLKGKTMVVIVPLDQRLVKAFSEPRGLNPEEVTQETFLKDFEENAKPFFGPASRIEFRDSLELIPEGTNIGTLETLKIYSTKGGQA